MTCTTAIFSLYPFWLLLLLGRHDVHAAFLGVSSNHHIDGLYSSKSPASSFLLQSKRSPQGLFSQERKNVKKGIVDKPFGIRSSSWILNSSPTPSSTSKNTSTTNKDISDINARRRELLSRDGPHFVLDRSAGRIEFGATARLVTELSSGKNDNGATDSDLIQDWLRDEESFAMSIWRPDLIEKKDNNVYRLQLMTLQFVTLQLAPWVDLRMKTVEDSKGLPVFTLQSINFDPNVKILPGVRISAETLGIVIEVAGQLRASPDGKGVTGSIAFETQGKLTSAFRLIPDSALKRASDAINQTVVNFAIKSFQTGAINNFRKYVEARGS